MPLGGSVTATNVANRATHKSQPLKEPFIPWLCAEGEEIPVSEHANGADETRSMPCTDVFGPGKRRACRRTVICAGPHAHRELKSRIDIECFSGGSENDFVHVCDAPARVWALRDLDLCLDLDAHAEWQLRHPDG